MKLLQAAADIVGGNDALAARLGIGAKTLARFLDDTRPLPDALLLRAVDLILADRQSKLLTDCRPVAETPQETRPKLRLSGGA